jgi:hypothetical protein
MVNICDEQRLSSFIYLENWNCKKKNIFWIKMWNGGCD